MTLRPNVSRGSYPLLSSVFLRVLTVQCSWNFLSFTLAVRKILTLSAFYWRTHICAFCLVFLGTSYNNGDEADGYNINAEMTTCDPPIATFIGPMTSLRAIQGVQQQNYHGRSIDSVWTGINQQKRYCGV
jgi:hypothetical protein